ncbi:mitochondrial phosphate carrier protein 3, mitochondrial-like protein [Tanacetum coccineum]
MDPVKYTSVSSGLKILLKEQGMRGLFKGWSPTLVGYAAQGACWFGFYEFFKKYYLDISGLEYAGLILLAAPSSAEVIASTVLCPMEAVKVRVQTQPGFARGLVDGLPKFVISEGALGLYKGLVPLWKRQIPYNATYCAFVEDIAVQYCFFDILLTSLSPRNCIPPEVLLRVSMHSACSTSENALEKPLDIRKLDNSSYQALGACFKPYKAFLKRSEEILSTDRFLLNWGVRSERILIRVDEGEPTGSTALEATIATGSGETESSKKAQGGDTGLGDERSMTEVSVKEQMKKLVG